MSLQDHHIGYRPWIFSSIEFFFFSLFWAGTLGETEPPPRSAWRQLRGLDGLDRRGAELHPPRSKQAGMSSTIGTTVAATCLLPACLPSKPPRRFFHTHTTSQPADEPLTSTAINDSTPHDSAQHIKTSPSQTAKVKQKQPSLSRTTQPLQVQAKPAAAACQPPQCSMAGYTIHDLPRIPQRTWTERPSAPNLCQQFVMAVRLTNRPRPPTANVCQQLVMAVRLPNKPSAPNVCQQFVNCRRVPLSIADVCLVNCRRVP